MTDAKPDPTGQICWLDIPVTNLAQAQKFYAEIFQWECSSDALPNPPPSGTQSMHMFNKGNLHGAFSLMSEGLAFSNHDSGNSKAIPVLPTLCVKDCAETLEKVASLGGKTQFPKTAIGGDMGFYARFVDPQNNMIGIWSQN